MPSSKSTPRLNARQQHIRELVQLSIDHSELDDRAWQKKYSFPKPRVLRDAVLCFELKGAPWRKRLPTRKLGMPRGADARRRQVVDRIAGRHRRETRRGGRS